MAIVYPKQMNENANTAEKKMYKILSQGLGHADVCYHNYNVVEKETDFMVVIPGDGIVVIEVKGWNGTNIEEVVDNDTIKYRNVHDQVEIYHSPLKQANGYRYKLANEVKEKLGINIKVCALVCYPFMSEETFKRKRLDLVSDREITILKDDLEDAHQFKYMLKRKCSYYISKGLEPFNQANYIKVRSLFEKAEDIAESTKLPIRKLKRTFAQKMYSIFSYIPGTLEEEQFKIQVEKYYYSWLSGTKIILVLESQAHKECIYHYFEEKLENEGSYFNNYSQFLFYDKEKEKYKDRIFNFEVHMGKLDMEPLELIDGKGTMNHEVQLRKIDKVTTFNLGQYQIEHHVQDKNILVKAGAGTGKTYSMVSRISYLYYIMGYAPEDLVNGIIMITFTNEAANNMKIRLKEHFTNLAILTEDVEYLRVMENISRMKISTIHSLCKKIIAHYSKYLGMGRSVSIKSGVYERRIEIQKILDDEIKQNDNYKALLLRVKKYELISTIEDLLDELERKNVNLEQNYAFDIPQQELELFELITTVAGRVQQDMIELNIQDNTVHLSNLMIYLGKLIIALEEQEHIKEKVDFLFVDEFQDTDDVQIDLIKRFYEIFKFKLFVVGDIKQSIYRFRGAEDKAFDKLKPGIGDWSDRDLSLNKNYRSDKILLEKFDKLFSHWSKMDVLNYSTDDKGNSDCLIGVKEDQSILEHITPISYEEQSFGDRLIEVINEKLKALDEKYEGKEERGKIAILTRKNEEIDTIREICSGRVNVDTDTAQNLYQLVPTKDLYYLILAIQFNTNPKYLYTLSQTNYSKGISNRVVYQSKTVPNRIPKAFKENKIINHWDKYMEDLRNKPVLRVIRDIIEDVKPWNNYANQFPGDERETKRKYYKINLDVLIEDIVQSSGEEYLTINKLEHYLYIKIFANQHQDERSIESKSSTHEIKCLTVHKSKGLEYDHIILPFVHSELTQIGKNKMIIKENTIYLRLKLNDELTITSQTFNKQIKQEKLDTLREEARILYVALTRAEDTVTWMKQKDLKEKENQKSWRLLLDQEV